MADLTIAYVGMSDQQLETSDETDLEISVTNNTGQSVVLTSLECDREEAEPNDPHMEFRTAKNPTYANPHTTDLRGENLVIVPNAALALTVGVRTNGIEEAGDETIYIHVGYEFVQPSSPIDGAIAITVVSD